MEECHIVLCKEMKRSLNDANIMKYLLVFGTLNFDVVLAIFW